LILTIYGRDLFTVLLEKTFIKKRNYNKQTKKKWINKEKMREIIIVRLKWLGALVASLFFSF